MEGVASRKSVNTCTPSRAHLSDLPGAVVPTQGAVPSTSTSTVTSMPSTAPGDPSSNSESDNDSVSFDLTSYLL